MAYMMKKNASGKLLFLFVSVPLLMQSAIADGKSVDFNSAVTVHKTKMCTIKLTQEGQNPIAVYKKHGKSGLLELEGNTSIKVTAQVEGGSDCRLGNIQLGIVHTNAEINGTPALHSDRSDYYFPFDYALGDSQLISPTGTVLKDKHIYDKIHKDSYGDGLP